MGVPINRSKSVFSDANHTRVEFAKRLFLNGVELTGLRPDILKIAAKAVRFLPDVLRVCNLRHWELEIGQLSAPPFLSDKGKGLLSVLLFDFTGGNAPVWGNVDPLVTYQALRTRVLELRKARIEKQVERTWQLLESNKDLLEMFSKEGVDVDPRLIGHQGFTPDFLHPIVWELNRRGEQFSDLLQRIEDITTPGTDFPFEELEYVPNLDNQVYFGEKHLLRTAYHSSLV